MSPKPKVGVSLYSYGWDIKLGKMTVKECIEHAASLGVEGIELIDKQHIPHYPHPTAYDLLDLRDYVESFGMKVACYSTYVDEYMRTGQPATFEEIVETVLIDIAEAHLLGTKNLRPAMAQTDEQRLPDARRVMEAVLPSLKKYDIKWPIEIHAPLRPKVLLNFVKEINDKNIGLTPDFSAWQRSGGQTLNGLDKDVAETVSGFIGNSSVELLRDCMPYSYNVHAKAHQFDEKGEEPTIPYGELIPIIKKSGYTGFICAEFEGWMMNRVDSRKIVKTHVDLIRRYL
jgi:sugar phosphate isomerase/epimerase